MKAPTVLGSAFFALAFISCVHGDIISFSPCSDIENQCTIHEIKVEPCGITARNKYCKARVGQSASISYEFTPNFSSDTFYSMPFWGNLDFPGYNPEGCQFTQCPITAGKRITYKHELVVGSKNPKGFYDVAWKMGKSKSEINCCFSLKIRVI